MSDYIATDQSTHDGAPVHLIKIIYQDTTHRWTTGDRDFTDSSGDLWEKNEIKPLSDLSVSDNLERTPVEISVPLDNPVAVLFRTTAIEASISIFIYEVHVEDGEVILVHSGRIMSRRAKLKGKNREAILRSEPLLTAIKRPAIREKTGLTCPYVLYDPITCKATKNGIVGTVVSINGTALVVSGADAEADGRLTSGYIETNYASRMITSHTGTSLTVTTQIQGLNVGDAVTMYIGCDHTTTDCEDLHDNINNFGGEPYIPFKNPHEGRMV